MDWSVIGRQVDSLPLEEQRRIKAWLSYSRSTLSLKAFGQCGEADLSLDRRMSDFDEFSCCKESVDGGREGDDEQGKGGCLPRWFAPRSPGALQNDKGRHQLSFLRAP